MTGAGATSTEDLVRAHYGVFDRARAAPGELAARGRDPERLAPDDLAPYDQLHTCGVAATAAVIAMLDARPGERVLDVGSGLGGVARLLNAARGCRVEGIDLTPGFVEIARDFTRRTGQDAAVSFRVGSATALPWEAGAFDAAYHVHMSMNVADKAAMYGEIARVVKPGGRLVLFDPIAGSRPGAAMAIRFPVPWAETPAGSFLLDRAAMQGLIEAAGFALDRSDDATAEGLAWFAELERARGAGAGPGGDLRFAAMSANHRANLSGGAVALWRARFVRRAD